MQIVFMVFKQTAEYMKVNLINLLEQKIVFLLNHISICFLSNSYVFSCLKLFSKTFTEICCPADGVKICSI